MQHFELALTGEILTALVRVAKRINSELEQGIPSMKSTSMKPGASSNRMFPGMMDCG
jgi:hypothetical protein